MRKYDSLRKKRRNSRTQLGVTQATQLGIPYYIGYLCDYIGIVKDFGNCSMVHFKSTSAKATQQALEF